MAVIVSETSAANSTRCLETLSTPIRSSHYAWWKPLVSVCIFFIHDVSEFTLPYFDWLESLQKSCLCGTHFLFVQTPRCVIELKDNTFKVFYLSTDA